MASRRSHAPTNDQQIEYELRVPRSGTYIMKPTASCEAAQLWVRASPPSKYSSPKGDLHILYDIEDDSRSRFAEPRDGEGMLIPQLRSFGACSGFLIDTCPIGTRRRLVGCYGGLRNTALIWGLLWWVAGHGADWGAAMGGCVATARRHSLLSLLHLLVNTA